MGHTKHDDFQMACGKMSPDEFIQFLISAMELTKDYSNDIFMSTIQPIKVETY
jgi:hypothetical protein